MESGATFEITFPQPREMWCLECRERFLRFDLDKIQPKDEGVFLTCAEHSR